MSQGRRTFVLLYTLSGAAGLVYEVSWTRLLALQVGHTVAAASTVLAAFMGGLAVGAWIAGHRRVADRRAGLHLYAALELVVALLALALPLALRAAVPLLASTYVDGGAPFRFALVRIVVALVLVGIPAIAMGATFPIAAGAFAKTPADAGVLYAANTAGAAAGAVAAGFWLVPALGLRGTTWVGVALNVAAAGGAFMLASRATASTAENAEVAARKPFKKKEAKAPRSQRSIPGSVPASDPSLAALAAGVSGFSALVYEVAWTRLIALVIGPTTYAFATMAASFILGLFVGSAVGTRLARRTPSPAGWLAAALMVGAVAATLSAWFAATRLPLDVAQQVADPNAALGAIVWRQAAMTATLLLPMTMALGAAFPLALALVGGDAAHVARDTARVYTANTVGAIAGALAGGFVLVPLLGLRDSIRAAAFFAALCGGFVLTRASGRTVARYAAAAIAVVAIASSPGWDRALLASGAYKYAAYLGANDLGAVLRAGSLAYYEEGAAGTVSVRDLTGTRSLAIDGKVDASNAGDMLTQRLLGLLPVLIHGNARDVAIIGLGSGVTAGSALAAGTVQRLDVIEISPQVVEASRLFDRENGRALAQPGVRLIVGDGRSHLLLTPRRYDVIVSEPSNPWMAGVASLFTREFFEAARSRLNAGGLLCQWAHTYDIETRDLRSIVATFSAVFPDGTMWLVGGGDLLLIGAADGAILPRLDAFSARGVPSSVDAALADVGIAPGTSTFVLLSLFAGGPAELARFGSGSTIQTDDRTALEYSAPRGIYGRTREDNAALIRALAPAAPPAVRASIERADDRAWTSRGTADLRAQSFSSAYDAFRQAVMINSQNSSALTGLSDAAGGSNRLAEERSWLEARAGHEPRNAAVRIELSRVRAVMGDEAGARQSASDALELAPDDPRAAEQLAAVLADSGDVSRLTSFADAMVQRFPNRPEAAYYRASALFMNGKAEETLPLLRGVLEAAPSHARAHTLLATACASLGRRDCAQAAFDAAIRANPRDPSGYINAGTFSLQIANSEIAAAYFASALAIDPSSAAARQGLAQAESNVRGR